MYHKAGALPQALKLCFSARLFGALRDVASDLDRSTNPDVLEKCASFFLDNGHYDKAVLLLVKGGKINEAIDLAAKRNVMITDDIAEQMTLPKEKKVRSY